MSCPPEATWLLYVDGESGEAERRALDAHLVGCRDCRGRVIVLRDESALLADVLMERERPARVTARPRVPEPGVAVGLPALIAAVTAALAAAGFLLDTRVPGGLDHLNPLNLKGAYEMAFDLLFLARDRVPGLIELALSIGAMASVSAILTLGVGVLYRRVYGATALALLALGATPDAGHALVVRIDQDTSVASGEVIAESMLLSGDRVHIDGLVEGDVWVAAERVVIGGTVKGNVYALCRDLDLTGTIDGSLHGAIEDARLDGRVEDGLYVAAESLTLAPDGSVGRDLAAIAETGLLAGSVGRDVIFGGEELELRSGVGRHVDVRWAQRVVLRDDASIGGNLAARLSDEDALDRAAGAQVGGEVSVEKWEHRPHRFFDRYRDPAFYAMHGLGLVAAFLFGLLLRWVSPALMETDLSTSPQFLRSLGYGFLVLVATPIAIVALGLTLVGLPVAVLAIFTYIVMVYSAELLVAAWIGRTLLPPRPDDWLSWSRSFFVGLALLTVATHVPIPFLGAAIMAVSLLIGTGLFFQTLREAAAARA